MFLLKTVGTLLCNSNHRLPLIPAEGGWGKMSRSTELSSHQVKIVLLGLIRDNMRKQEGPQGFLSCKVFFHKRWTLSLWRAQALTSQGTPFGCRTMTVNTGDFDSENLQPHTHTRRFLRDWYLGLLHGHPFHTRPR